MTKMRAVLTVEIEVDRADPDCEAVEAEIVELLRRGAVRLSDRIEQAVGHQVDRELTADPDFEVVCDLTWEAT